MNAHLLAIALGPVQEFIAQARRTRDLWFGSHLLSELARAAAKELVKGGAQLIFPSLNHGDPELLPCLGTLRPNGEPPHNISNKLLAEVPAGVDPAQLARAVREAIAAFWRDQIAADVKTRCRGLLADGIDQTWQEQIDSFVEFTAAWAPLDSYQAALNRVEAAIAARKNLREFSQWVNQREGVPKSSLDGARESVLAEPDKRDPDLVKRYRIAEGEQLDAVGLVKRAGGDPKQFVPVINVALSSWLATAAELIPDKLEAAKKASAQIGLGRVYRRDLPCAAVFPYDASIFLPSRWEPVFQEQGLAGDPHEWGREVVRPILQTLGDPYPYVACLVADGDRMGKTLQALDSPDKHRRFSAAVAEFASKAREIVERKHSGVLIYSGGDDVLAFVPLRDSLGCAETLRLAFGDVMQRASGICGLSEDSRPTLSVGIGVGHVLESMGHLLELGRAAEREAKKHRNSLAVVVEKRSGGKRVWSASWEEDPVGRLIGDIDVLSRHLSTRKVYELAAILRGLPDKHISDPKSEWVEVLCQEVRRSLSRVGEARVEPDAVGLHLDEERTYEKLHERVSGWVNRMLIAMVIARGIPNRHSEA